jgi:uncharacterized protein (TIGR03435 family)
MSRALLTATGLVVLVVELALSQSGRVFADAKPQMQTGPAKSLTFEVVSIRPNKTGTRNELHWDFPTDGDGIRITSMTVEDFLYFAYGIQDRHLFSGLPDWAKSDRYDLNAKVDDTDVAAYHTLTSAQRKTMLQALLSQTFIVKSHYEQRDIPAYTLIVGKSGPKMTVVKSGGPHPNAPKGRDGAPVEGSMLYSAGPGVMIGQEISMSVFAGSLSGIAGRQVVDKTGLGGLYDFTLKWTADQGPPQSSRAGETASPPADVSGPSIFTAIQEELGLKLEPEKLSRNVLVIDHIEKPSEN